MSGELIIKGLRAGVLVTLPGVLWTRQRDLLIKHLQARERFFKGGRIALDVGGTEWNQAAIASLLKDVGDEGVCLWAVISSNEVTRKAAEEFDLATSVRQTVGSEPEPMKEPIEPPLKWLSGGLGEETNFEWNGDLVLIGDVPADSSVTCSGNLLIWGKVSGKVSFGNQLCMLACDHPAVYWHDKPINLPKKLRKGQGVVIRADNDMILIESDLKGGFKLL
ncbi:MAG TPA: hypothetical protein PKK82_06830 [Anaerolineaceae bacterium]|nr:hypothetical protein [Anaerolineaceae bacterium]